MMQYLRLHDVKYGALPAAEAVSADHMTDAKAVLDVMDAAYHSANGKLKWCLFGMPEIEQVKGAFSMAIRSPQT